MANVYCCFHQWYRPNEPAPVVREAPGDQDQHGGICPSCREDYEAERIAVHALTPAEILRGATRAEVKQ